MWARVGQVVTTLHLVVFPLSASMQEQVLTGKTIRYTCLKQVLYHIHGKSRLVLHA